MNVAHIMWNSHNHNLSIHRLRHLYSKIILSLINISFPAEISKHSYKVCINLQICMDSKTSHHGVYPVTVLRFILTSFKQKHKVFIYFLQCTSSRWGM